MTISDDTVRKALEVLDRHVDDTLEALVIVAAELSARPGDRSLHALFQRTTVDAHRVATLRRALSDAP